MIGKILVIPDTQVKAGVDLSHLVDMSHWIVENRPDVIVHIGDHWDMPSLSSYDKGTARAEGRRVREDIEVGNDAMRLLLQPLRDLQAQQRSNRKRVYSPEMHFFIGNHEERITRYENANPEVQGAIGWDQLDLRDWRVHGFLQPHTIGGVAFAHYFYNPNSGKPFGGTMDYRLNKVKQSFVQGHEQGMKYAYDCIGTRRIHGLMVGSFYKHDEHYKGPQGNSHWRGFAVLNNVEDGDYDLELHRIN